MTHKCLTSLVLLTSAGLLAVGCSNADDKKDVAANRAYLTQAMDCDDLLGMLKADALAKLNATFDVDIALLRMDYDYDYDEGGSKDLGGPGAVAGSVANDASDSSTVGISGNNEAFADRESGVDYSSEDGAGYWHDEYANEHSDTNTQVADVDEADIVKTDGRYIYLLHGQEFLVLKAWPAAELAQSSSFGIEGSPLEMFVTNDGKVVVYSIVNGASVYAEAGLTPRDTYGEFASYGEGSLVVAPDSEPGSYSYNPLTKITVLQLQNTQPTVLSEMYFEGYYESSRRVDNYVRTILQGASFGPSLELWLDCDTCSTLDQWEAAIEQLRAENIARIDDTTIEDWLPYYMVRTDDGVQAHFSSCSEFYVPTAASTGYGMTQIQSIDLAVPENLPTGASIIGSTYAVYSNADTLVLAASAWFDPQVYLDLYSDYKNYHDDYEQEEPGDAPQVDWSSDADAGATVGQGGSNGSGYESGEGGIGEDGGIGKSRSALNEDSVSLLRTHLHTFDLVADPATPRYTASGTVQGEVLNQFSMDVHDEHLRVAVTDWVIAKEQYWRDDTVNHVIVLREDAGELVETGAVRDLAPGENIYSTRFVGERGYVVTFRQVDPLFVFDLSDPTAPTLLGELKIPGFSEYMHPLDSNHLLTIGQDNGLALQIFDVTDPVHPVQKHKYAYSSTDMYGYSEAQVNHRAFNYYASRGLLAFPFVGWDNSSYDYRMRSSLELFDIDTDKGISRRGSIDHTALFGSVANPYDYCGGYYDVQVRRGVFLDDYVFSISYGGVVANHVDNLNEPVATFVLDPPTSSGYDCSGGVIWE